MIEQDKQIIVFCGPSGFSNLEKNYPSFHFREPAQQGDIYHAANICQPTAIILIDGYYKSVPSVWHKEIIYAIEQGITVIGSASLGALRAVELEPYGMIGLGRIYKMYKNGILYRDPDVAVAHTGKDDCFRSLTVPIVNIHATLSNNLPGLCVNAFNEVLDIARGIHFEYRTLESLLKALTNSSLSEDLLFQVSDILSNQYVDQKAIDADYALSWACKNLPSGGSERAPFLSRTHYWTALKDNDTYIDQESTGLYPTKIGLLAYQLLERPDDFMAMRDRSITIELCLWLATLYQIEATDEEIDEVRTQLMLDLAISESDYQSWLAERGLSPVDCHEYLRACVIEKKVKDKAHQVNVMSSFNQWHYIQAALSENSQYLLKSYKNMLNSQLNHSISAIVSETQSVDYIPIKTQRVLERYRRTYMLLKAKDVFFSITRFPSDCVVNYAKIHQRFKREIGLALGRLFASSN